MSCGGGTSLKKMVETSYVLKQRIIEDPLNAKNYLKLGWHQHLCVEYQKAIKTYKCGLKVCGGNTDLHCKLGLTYHNEGQHKEAIEQYKKAVSLQPKNYEAKYYLGFIMIQELEYAEAIKYLKEVINLKEDMIWHTIIWDTLENLQKRRSNRNTYQKSYKECS